MKKKEIANQILGKPIIQMTGWEFMQLIIMSKEFGSLFSSSVNKNPWDAFMDKEPKTKEEKTGPFVTEKPKEFKGRLIKGRGALAAELGVSVMTLIDWEKKGFFKKIKEAFN